MRTDDVVGQNTGARATMAVGLGAVLLGLAIGGVGVAEYLRADLFADPTDGRVVEAAALRDAARGAIAVSFGSLVWLAGLIRARRRVPADGRPAPQRTPSTTDRARDAAGITLEQTLPTETLANTSANGNGSPLKAPRGLAAQVWRCRLAVDLQHQRLRHEGIGAETQIDAELYAMAIRNLLRATRFAQSTCGSERIADAIHRFLSVTPDEDLAVVLEHIDTYEPPKPRGRKRARLDDPAAAVPRAVGIEFGDDGTVLVLAGIRIGLVSLTDAADTLANIVVGELTEVRAMTKRASKRPAAVAPAPSEQT